MGRAEAAGRAVGAGVAGRGEGQKGWEGQGGRGRKGWEGQGGRGQKGWEGQGGRGREGKSRGKTGEKDRKG